MNPRLIVDRQRYTTSPNVIFDEDGEVSIMIFQEPEGDEYAAMLPAQTSVCLNFSIHEWEAFKAFVDSHIEAGPETIRALPDDNITPAELIASLAKSITPPAPSQTP